MEGGNTGMSAITTLFTTITGFMGDIITTIVSNPLFLLPVGIMVVGAVIGLAKRLIGR